MNDPMAQQAQQYADLDRRLRAMEGGQRLGLAGLRSAWGTAAADPTVFGAYESGPIGSTWEDDAGNTGTGYPSITIENCPKRYMIIWSARPMNIATNAVWDFRSVGGEVTVAINGADHLLLPNARRAFGNANPESIDIPISALVARRDAPGTRTFQMRALWADSNPAGAGLPRLTDIYLGVLPLSIA